MTPEHFEGLWKRRSISIDGVEPMEPGHVYWFQSGDAFLDIRQPRSQGPMSGPGCVAGRTRWSAPELTWEHHLDTHRLDALAARGMSVPGEPDGAMDADVGVITWDGDTLIEAGSCVLDGRTASYIEEWERIDPRGVTREVWTFTSGEGTAIQIGRYRAALLVDPISSRWSAIFHHKVRGHWRAEIQLGDQGLLSRLNTLLSLTRMQTAEMEYT